MGQQSIIVIGASAGGVEALSRLFARLKPDLNAAFFIVLHLPPDADSNLDVILNRRSSIPVSTAQDGETIEMGHAYAAPPNRHLIIEDGRMGLMFGPRVNHTRPAVDPLFESAAWQYGSDVIGVILSGSLYDGTMGLMSIKRAGGTAIVQDPKEALFPDMPSSALQYVQVDYTLPVNKIAALLNQIADQGFLEKGKRPVSKSIPDSSTDESDLIKRDFENYENGYGSDERSVLTCPDCGGVLWELQDGQLVRYRCHTGHIYNAENILASHNEQLEKAFWTVLRMLTEKAALANRLALRARDNGDEEREKHYLDEAREAEEDVEVIRKTWFHGAGKRPATKGAGEEVNEDVTRDNE